MLAKWFIVSYIGLLMLAAKSKIIGWCEAPNCGLPYRHWHIGWLLRRRSQRLEGRRDA